MALSCMFNSSHYFIVYGIVMLNWPISCACQWKYFVIIMNVFSAQGKECKNPLFIYITEISSEFSFQDKSRTSPKFKTSHVLCMERSYYHHPLIGLIEANCVKIVTF
ncbi:hypothetical protein NE237_031839 [Protea cynaroides]|uniref:Uncharacterized protein n=1 Tax=Protea cynaroides TaxID=273540 RepID=A0A9Q0L265_9MAGN|nr:hypothetical protein NE237_031839 [Protea cynaroides]